MAAGVLIEWLLGASAALGLLWVLIPLMMATLGLRPVHVSVRPDPRSVAPGSGDLGYRALFYQLVVLGFRPLGTTTEIGWFQTPLRWRWREPQGERWLASADRQTFVALHRIIPAEPLRISAVTLLEGGGLVRTDCPGTGAARDSHQRYRRFEVQHVDVEDLLIRHRQNVEAVTRDGRFTLRPATLRDLAAEGAARARLDLQQQKVGAYWQLTLAAFAVPLMAYAFLVLAAPQDDAHRLRDLALATLGGTAIFAVVRQYVLTIHLPEQTLKHHGLRR